MPKGFSNYNQSGWKHSEKAKIKIKKKRKCQIFTAKTRRKMRLAHLGKKHTKEELKKMSKSQKGKIIGLKTRLKMSLWQIGERNNRWKGGITPLRRKIRNFGNYQRWRNEILKRDEGICILCLKEDSNIIDHYPMTFKHIIEKFKIETTKDALLCKKLWDINNGRILCDECNYRETYARAKFRNY